LYSIHPGFKTFQSLVISLDQSKANNQIPWRENNKSMSKIMKLVAVLIVCLALVQANDQALKCFKTGVDAVQFELARYQKVLTTAANSPCTKREFQAFQTCFTYYGPKTQVLKKMEKHEDPCPRIDDLSSCVGSCYAGQAKKNILSAYWKVETVYVRSIIHGYKKGNEEIAVKMEHCSSPFADTSKADYKIC
jgi:hypothetical protein